MIRLPVLVAVCLLAGCGAAPTDGGSTTAIPDGTTVDVTLTNDDDEAYAVSVSITQGPLDGVYVTYENGSAREFDVRDVSEIPPPALEDAAAVEPLGTGVRTERYDLSPNTGIGDTFTAPRPSTLVYVVTKPGEGMRSVGKLTCGASASRSSVRVVVAPDGSLAVSNACS